MKISASLIIKNEEEMLPACLKSIKGVDEIIVVDTGSTDKSIEIAKAAGAKVYTDYKWADNFAEARNESKKHCTGDWLLIIDGDETLESIIPSLRKLINEPFMKDKDGVMFKVTAGQETNDQIRLFRNDPAIEWVGAAHNLPHVKTERGYVHMDFQDSLFKIKAKFGPNHIKDPDRTLRIMTNELAKGPQVIGPQMHTRYIYYVAREWLNRKDPFRVVWYLEEYVKIAPPTNELADAWFMLATCYINLGQQERAVDACFKCVKYVPHFKAAWALIHNLSHESVRPVWAKMTSMANNSDVIFKRPDQEKLIKPKKS